MIVARLAFVEGLQRLSEVARSLSLRSSGHVSNLVRRCEEAMRQHRDVARLVDECLFRLRPPAMAIA